MTVAAESTFIRSPLRRHSLTGKDMNILKITFARPDWLPREIQAPTQIAKVNNDIDRLAITENAARNADDPVKLQDLARKAADMRLQVLAQAIAARQLLDGYYLAFE